MKTTFSSGVIVTSEWLNGAKQIRFDGQDLDWHYNPLGLDSLILQGPNGLDSRYVTLETNQPNVAANETYISGFSIGGDKIVSGRWSFGFNPAQNPGLIQESENAPRSYLSNLKYDSGGATKALKYGGLVDSHLITKRILSERLSILEIDNGEY